MTCAFPLGAWADFLAWEFLGNTPLQWLGLLGILLASLIVGKVLSFFLQRQATRFEEAQKLPAMVVLLRSIPQPATMMALGGGLYVALGAGILTLRDNSAVFWNQACQAITVLAAGWFIYRLVDLVEIYLAKISARSETTLDDQLVPLVRKSLRVFVVVVVVLFVAQNVFAWNIGALIAGLGIGGLAFALAAKDMLANLFGSMTIFADRPFRMGDRVRIAGHEGDVEEVGFRSTRIRTLAGHVTTLPNSVVANEAVENVSARPFIRRSMQVTVTYDTSPDKLQRALDILKEMLEARIEHFHEDKPYRVYFRDFGATSLDLSVDYWFVPAEWYDFLDFNQAFNLELLRRFNEEGVEFAFPTQTVYVKQDSPLRAEITRNGGGEPELRGPYT